MTTPTTPETLAQIVGGGLVGFLGLGYTAWRFVRRSASTDKTAIAGDDAKRDHLATLQAENKQLRERHDSMSQKYADAMHLAGELSGKVDAQTHTIEALRAEVAALRQVVADQTETIGQLQHQLLDLLTVIVERNGTGPLPTVPVAPIEPGPAQA